MTPGNNKKTALIRQQQMAGARPVGVLPGPPSLQCPIALGKIVAVDLTGEVPVHTVELVVPGYVAGVGAQLQRVPEAQGQELAVDDPVGDRSLVLVLRVGNELACVPIASGGGGLSGASYTIYSVNRAPMFQA